MSKWSRSGDDLRRRVYRAVVVQAFGDYDGDALDYLGDTSRADDGRRPRRD